MRVFWVWKYGVHMHMYFEAPTSVCNSSWLESLGEGGEVAMEIFWESSVWSRLSEKWAWFEGNVFPSDVAVWERELEARNRCSEPFVLFELIVPPNSGDLYK